MFMILVLTYFIFTLTKLVKDHKRAEFFEESDKEVEAKKEEFSADKQLERNLFIINTFEDFHERKITPDELKTFTEMFAQNDVSKQVMKDKIENFKVEHVSDNDHIEELLEISGKLSKVIENLKNKSKSEPPRKDTKKSIEKFSQGYEPFNTTNKYMPIM